MSQSRWSRMSEYMEANWFPGITPKTLRHHNSVTPLLGCMIVGWLWAGYFSLRTLFTNPDSCLREFNYYDRYRDGTYFKFFNITGLKLKTVAPIYRREGDPTDEEMCLPDW